MQWSGISKPAPIHTVLPSFQSQHPSGWNWSRFVCTCLKQPGIAWGYFGVRYKHGEPAELIRLLLLSKPPGILRIDHGSWKPSHSSLWVFPQHVCHISSHAKREPGKGKTKLIQVPPCTCEQSGHFSVLKSTFCFIQNPGAYWFFWWEPADYHGIKSPSVALLDEEGRERGRAAKGDESASAFGFQYEPQVLCKPVLNLSSNKDFIRCVERCVNKRETQNQID